MNDLVQRLQSIVEGGEPDKAGRGYVLNLLADSCIEIRRLRKLIEDNELSREVERLREALRIVAEGTLCPELFPKLDLEKDVWELQAKTAMTSAIAALERNGEAQRASLPAGPGARI